MLKNCVLPIVLTLMVTQTAQASDHTLRQIGQDRGSPTQFRASSFAKYQPKLASSIDAPISMVEFPTTGIQTQPQGQAAPSHSHRHTLRNLVIITVAVFAMCVVLASVAKK